MVAAPDLGSGAARRGGSSPFFRTALTRSFFDRVFCLNGIVIRHAYKNFVLRRLFYKFDKAIYIMDNKQKQAFDKAELDLLKEGLKRNYKERFEMATRLFKIQQTMNKATIAHKPFIIK